jgi:hypothetical protein
MTGASDVKLDIRLASYSLILQKQIEELIGLYKEML